MKNAAAYRNDTDTLPRYCFQDQKFIMGGGVLASL